jgi:hypothetical protein
VENAPVIAASDDPSMTRRHRPRHSVTLAVLLLAGSLVMGATPVFARLPRGDLHVVAPRGAEPLARGRRGPGTRLAPGPTVAVATATTTTTQGAQTSEGVVQSISPRAVVLRELDGTTVTLEVGPQTVVLIDGNPGALWQVRPGYVVEASSLGGTATQLSFVKSD